MKIDAIKFRDAIQVDSWVGNNLVSSTKGISVDYANRCVIIAGNTVVPFENVVCFRIAPIVEEPAPLPAPDGPSVESKSVQRRLAAQKGRVA